jgi:hypothetical protein
LFHSSGVSEGGIKLSNCLRVRYVESLTVINSGTSRDILSLCRPISFCGNTLEAQALARKMAASWATFAATGNPSVPGLKWDASNPESNPTMIWDNQCHMMDDPDGEARRILLA